MIIIGVFESCSGVSLFTQSTPNRMFCSSHRPTVISLPLFDVCASPLDVAQKHAPVELGTAEPRPGLARLARLGSAEDRVFRGGVKGLYGSLHGTMYPGSQNGL